MLAYPPRKGKLMQEVWKVLTQMLSIYSWKHVEKFGRWQLSIIVTDGPYISHEFYF